MAKIVFQKKQYHLGRYDTAEDAAEVRKKAEEVLFACFSNYYEQWRKLADADPQWAEENPIRISVEKKDSEIVLTMTPFLPQVADGN